MSRERTPSVTSGSVAEGQELVHNGTTPKKPLECGRRLQCQSRVDHSPRCRVPRYNQRRHLTSVTTDQSKNKHFSVAAKKSARCVMWCGGGGGADVVLDTCVLVRRASRVQTDQGDARHLGRLLPASAPPDPALMAGLHALHACAGPQKQTRHVASFRPLL